MDPIQLQYGGITDVGRVRERNEDAYLVSPPVFVVADGMGGHDGGDVASGIVVEEFASLADPTPEPALDLARGREVIAGALARSHQRISEFSAAQPDRDGHRFRAGTTAVVALLVEDDGPQWLLANLGDSRIYRLDGGRLEQVSVDHSLVQQMVSSGRISPAEAATHPERNVVTRALGIAGSVEPDYFRLPAAPGVRLLLCSDGVSEMIADDQIAAILAEESDPEAAAEQVVAVAVEAGGRDNATAVVVDVVKSVSATSADSAHQPASLEESPGALS